MTREIPKQLVEGPLTKFLQDYSIGLKASLQSLTYGTLALNFILTASLSMLWGMINTVQLIIYIPLYNLMFPANAILFYSLLAQLA